MVTIASASLRSPPRPASSRARSSAASAASSATDSRSSWAAAPQSCSCPAQATNQLLILGSPPTPNSEYFPSPAAGICGPPTRTAAGSRSALRYSPARRTPSGPGSSGPVPPTTRPVAVSSQQSAPVSRPISRSMASRPAPSATADSRSLRRPSTLVMAATRSPFRRRPTSSVTAAKEVSAGTASTAMPCWPHARITSGFTSPRASPAPSTPAPARARARANRSASAGSRHQIMPVRTRSPGVR